MANNTEKRITAKMVLDSTGYNDKLKGLNAEMKKHQSELKLASEGIKQFGADSEKLKSVQESLSKQVELHSKKVELYKQSMEKATSKMQDNIKKRDELKSSLDQANKKYDEAVKMYGKESTEAKKAKEEVDKLKTEHEKASKSVEINAKQIQNYETNMNKANAEMVKAKGNLNQVTDELNKQNNKWVQASEKLGEHSKKLTDAGEKITDVGKSITTKVSVPLAGLGVIALKTTASYDDSMSQLKAITNSSAGDMEKLNAKAKEMGIQTKYSAKEAADSMVMLGQAGYRTGEIVNTLPAVLNLAQAGAIDLTQSTDVLVSSMSQFGIKTENAAHVADVLSLGANKANLGVGDLAESMKYAGAMANTAGWSIEDTTAAIGLMSNYGIKGSQSGTVLRGAISRLVKPSKDAAETMDNLGIKVFSSAGKMKSLPQILDEVKKGTSKLTEEQKMNALVTLFGQEAVSGMNALLKEGGNSVRSYSAELKNADGSAAKAAATMEDNLGGSVRSLKSAMEGAAISIGTAAAPAIREITDKITELTRRFAALSPETQKNIVKFGAFAIATGPAIVGIGKLATGLGSIIGFAGKTAGVIGKLTLATKGVSAATKGAEVATGLAANGMSDMGLATKASTLLLNPWVLGIGAVALAGVGLAKHLKEDAVPSVDLFADKVEHTTETVTNSAGELENQMVTTTTKISEETKKAVGAYMELDKGATESLTNMYTSMTVLTDTNTKGLISTYDQMNQQIQSGFDKHYQERTTSLQKFFAESTALSDKEEAEILRKEKFVNDERKASQEEFHKKINHILQTASKEKRTLTADEVREINGYQENMRQNAVTTLSKQEVESKVIMERLKSNSTRLTTETASNVIKNAEKQRQESVNAAEKQFDETVANIIKMRDETHSITKEQADKMIKEAERQRDQSINKAKLLKDGVVEQIRRMNGDIIDDINTTDGSIKDRWTKLKDWFSNNPITRMIKTVVEKSQEELAGHNWTGTNYWRGGLTYLHDAPGKNSNYELYDLPRGTRIFNHDASEDMVRQTAEQVATKVAEGMLNKFNGANGINVTQNIYTPTSSPSEVARQTKNSLRELALNW